MPPELAEVRAWLVKAQHDRLAARQLFAPDTVVLDVIAFHCHQAAEKTLKAFLVSRQVQFEKTRDLAWLLDLCTINGASVRRRRRFLCPWRATEP